MESVDVPSDNFEKEAALQSIKSDRVNTPIRDSLELWNGVLDNETVLFGVMGLGKCADIFSCRVNSLC